jgi:hypothetical protein
MISGLKKASAAISIALASVAYAAEFEVAELMDMLSSVRKSEARFTETRHMAMLDEPLVLSGTLSYMRPDKIEKKVTSPYSERLSIDGNTLTFETKGETKALMLDHEPLLRAFVESVRATRSGDVSTLERFYEIDLTGDAGAWTLTLRPNDAAVRKQVKAVVMSGQNERILQVEVFETGGDRSIMVIDEELS